MARHDGDGVPESRDIAEKVRAAEHVAAVSLEGDRARYLVLDATAEYEPSSKRRRLGAHTVGKAGGDVSGDQLKLRDGGHVNGAEANETSRQPLDNGATDNRNGLRAGRREGTRSS